MTSIRWVGRNSYAAAATILSLACDGSSGDDDGPTGNTFAIQIAVSRDQFPVAQGSSGTTEVTLTRSGGFAGAVALAATGFPAGVTVAIDPPQLVGSASRATVTLTVAASLATGIYTGSVEASAMSIRSSIDIRLVVEAAPAFALKMAPATAFTIPAGRTATAELNIQHTPNFSSAISVSLLNPPGGISATFLPNPVQSVLSTMTISVAPNVAQGNYPVTLQATATGLSPRELPLSITVVPAPIAGSNVTYYFCNAVDVPAFLAYQDGTGPWQAVTGIVSGGTTTFSLNVAQGRGAVLSTYPHALSTVAQLRADMRVNARSRATVGSRLSARRLVAGGAATRLSNAAPLAAVGEAYDTYVFYGSTPELVQDGRDACVQEPQTKTVKASVLGVTAGQYGVFSLGSSTGVFDGAQPTNPFTLHDVPAGLQDLVGSRIVTPGMPPDKLILIRNVNVPDGGTLPQAIDYNGPASVVPATATATVTGAAGDQLEIFVDLITLKGSNQLWFDLAPSVATARPWAGFSAANMVLGDMHRVWVFATRSADPLVFRVYSRVAGPVSNQDFPLGPDLAAPTVSMAAGGSHPRFGFQGSINALAYNNGIFIDLVGENDGSNAYYLYASGAYLGASGSAAPYNVTMPDVAALPGFPTDSRLTTGVNVVSLAAVGFSGIEGLLTFGWDVREAHRTLKINVP